MIIRREWAMPSSDTFSVKPIKEFVDRYLCRSQKSIDPFARNFTGASFRNDLDPNTLATFHMEALDFLNLMALTESPFDLGIFDPPYSPRQISECYKGIGKKAGMGDTQASFWKKLKDSLDTLIAPDGIVLSFGWNSNGMGKSRGYKIEEILIVAHGAAHNDTICVAERKL